MDIFIKINSRILKIVSINFFLKTIRYFQNPGKNYDMKLKTINNYNEIKNNKL